MPCPSWADSSKITLIDKSLYFIQVIWVSKSRCHDVKDDGKDSQEKKRYMKSRNTEFCKGDNSVSMKNPVSYNNCQISWVAEFFPH